MEGGKAKVKENAFFLYGEMKCSLKNVRCETSVLFLIERSFNRGAIGYVPSFSLKVVFFFIFFKLWRQGSSYPPRKTFCDSLDAIWPRHDFVSFG